MTSSARDWGVTLVRLWAGFLIAHAAYLRAGDQLTAFNLALGLSGLWTPFSAAPLTHAATLVELLGGAAVLLGVAVRPAALLCAASLGLGLWGRGALRAGALLDHRLAVTLLVVSLALALTGPGRLNLGALFRRRR